MKRFALVLYLAALPWNLGADFNESTELEQAKRATAAYSSALKSELVSAMQSGGPIQAIEVCNNRAPAIGNDVSVETGMTLSRVSLRNRNPGNVPNNWQTGVLNSFEVRKEAGEAPATLVWYQLANTEDGREFRFMKAIPTGALCLQCHGEAIAPQVANKLAELYPDDKATGFSEGDIRGAFVVTRQLD